jgi:two-component system cell cycle sensor histidine kinase/response regulator CckA
MSDPEPTRAQLMAEVAALRERVVTLESSVEAHQTNFDAARSSEERYRLISKLASDYVYSVRFDEPPPPIDPSGENWKTYRQYTIEWVTEAFQRVTGYTTEEIRTQGNWMCVIHPDDRSRLVKFTEDLMRGRRSTAEYRIVTKQGNIRWLRDACEPIWDAKKKQVVRLYGAVRDITERKQANSALRDSEEMFRQLAENIHGALWISDANSTKMLYISPAYEEIYGRPRHEVLDDIERWRDAVHPDDLARVDLSRSQNSEQKEAHPEPHDQKGAEYRIIRPDGTIRWVWNRAFPIRNEAGEIYRLAGIAEDVTARKQLEDQLRQSQKMEAVGRLAGGVAHDFNNLLTGIIGYSGIVLNELAPADPARELVEEIQKASERAALLTNQLLAFSRKQVLAPQVLNLGSVIADMAPMLRRLIGEHIELIHVPEPLVGSVRADMGQLQQVIVNLVLNARDALPQGGTVLLNTSNIDVQRFTATLPENLAPGPYVQLAVTDTGIGMNTEVRSHLFEPFFTTKEIGKGTGLGLPTIYGIVTQSGAFIEVESEVGQGATFRIYLPRVPDIAPRELEAKVARGPARGSETILLVEDEDLVRALELRILRQHGYTVLSTAQGAQALLISQSHPGPIQLLVTDVVMPEMSGSELAERLNLLRPEMKVLFLSGHTDDAIIHHGVLDNGVAFLQKPFTPAVFVQKVREVLDQK